MIIVVIRTNNKHHFRRKEEKKKKKKKRPGRKAAVQRKTQIDDQSIEDSLPRMLEDKDSAGDRSASCRPREEKQK